jgi:hypothetical protein
VRKLLDFDVNVNLGVTAMSRDFGNTALHALVSDVRAGSESTAQLEIVSMLVEHPSTNLCVYNGLGKTPYMSVSTKHQKLLQALRPEVEWANIELILEVNENRDALAQALADLAQKVPDIRLADLLFCEHEGPGEELQRRRHMLWEGSLRPITHDVCPRRPLVKSEKELFTYCWSASQGPPLSIRQGSHNARIAAIVKTARESYRNDMARVLDEVSADFEAQAMPLYEELLVDEYGAMLAAIPEKKSKLLPKEMNHGRFLETPTWAQTKNFPAALADLVAVGVLRAEGEFGDLFQQGRHRLFGTESMKAIFADGDSLQFWMGLVAMWMIGVHELQADAFNAKMRSFCKEEEFHAAPGVKGYVRWLLIHFPITVSQT